MKIHQRAMQALAKNRIEDRLDREIRPYKAA